MSEPRPQPPLPRDKETLLREVNARIRIKDIKALYRLRDEIEVKWWEPLVLLLLFCSALGFLGFIVLILMNVKPSVQPLLQKSSLIWCIPLVLTLVLTLEMVLSRLNALRQLNRRMLQLLEDMQRQMEEEKGKEEKNGGAREI